jgi:hypothetical protein
MKIPTNSSDSEISENRKSREIVVYAELKPAK